MFVVESIELVEEEDEEVDKIEEMKAEEFMLPLHMVNAKSEVIEKKSTNVSMINVDKLDNEKTDSENKSAASCQSAPLSKRKVKEFTLKNQKTEEMKEELQ